MASGDGWSVDAGELYNVSTSGDGWSVDAAPGLVNLSTGAATATVEVMPVLRSTEGAAATMAVDTNLVALPSPARLKRWDGTQWVPGRMYYYDNVSQTWLPSS